MKRGRKLSAAHKAAIAAAHRGRHHSAETKLRMSLARREMTRQKYGTRHLEATPPEGFERIRLMLLALADEADK